MTDPVSPTTDSPATGDPLQAEPQRSAAEIALGHAQAAQQEQARRVADDSSPISLLEGDDPLHTDDERLEASPLEEWFPGVGWRTLVTWLGGTCYQSTDGTLTLIVESGGHTAAGNVRYTRPGPWEGGAIGYWGPVVTSAAEVGALLEEDSVE